MNIGDIVEHTRYGQGQVINIRDNYARIAFEGGQVFEYDINSLNENTAIRAAFNAARKAYADVKDKDKAEKERVKNTKAMIADHQAKAIMLRKAAAAAVKAGADEADTEHFHKKADEHDAHAKRLSGESEHTTPADPEPEHDQNPSATAPGQEHDQKPSAHPYGVHPVNLATLAQHEPRHGLASPQQPDHTVRLLHAHIQKLHNHINNIHEILQSAVHHAIRTRQDVFHQSHPLSGIARAMFRLRRQAGALPEEFEKVNETSATKMRKYPSAKRNK